METKYHYNIHLPVNKKMNFFGEMNDTGSVLSKTEMRELRRRRGECENCGTKCFEKHLFKAIAITNGEVVNGRCLQCNPFTEYEIFHEAQKRRKSALRSLRKKKFFRINSESSSIGGNSHEIRNHSFNCNNLPESNSSLSSISVDSTICTQVTSTDFNSEEMKNVDVIDKSVPKYGNAKVDRATNSCIYSQAIAYAAAQLQFEKDSKSSIFDLDEIQILSKMEKLTCSYKDIIEVAALFPFLFRVQQRAIQLLSKFALTESDFLWILNNGFKDIIISGMENFPKDKEFQLDACSFLMKLSAASNESKIAAARAGSVQTILNLMCNFSNDKEVQHFALLLLSDLCQVKEIELLVFKLGGIKTIVEVMTISNKQ